MLRFFGKKRLLVNVRSKYLFLDILIIVRVNRVGDPGRRSIRLGDNFDWLGDPLCVAHGCSAPFPSLSHISEIKIDIDIFWNFFFCISLDFLSCFFLTISLSSPIFLNFYFHFYFYFYIHYIVWCLNPV